MRRWFVARTIARAELKMRDYFMAQGVECFVPTRKELLKKGGEVIETEVALIPNLIFFKATYAEAHIHFNLNARKIYRIRTNSEMLCVPDAQMESFMHFINENYGKVQILSPEYRIGDMMIIKKGPLAGMRGKVILINNRNYFTINVEGLFIAATKVPKSNLIKVEEAEQKKGKAYHI